MIVQHILVPVLIIAVIGFVISEILLVIAMVKPNDKITTGRAGTWILVFLIIAVVTVMAMMAAPNA